MVNVVYALMVEQADALDRAEIGLAPHADDDKRVDLARNREDLDVRLLAPLGRQALAEQALIRELGGAA